MVKHLLKNISEVPDFALVSEDKSKLFMVEVKYHTIFNFLTIKKHAEKLIRNWEYSWLFIATPEGFYCDMSKRIIGKNDMEKLPESWVSRARQDHYLKLLNEFRINS